MGYCSMATGDAPISKSLADHYSMSDNYHQSISGGTGANHIAIGMADDASYQDASGAPAVPPANQIENPNPKPGTNNNFTRDGYQGGSFSNCSDPSQPGVAAILDYLATRHPYRGAGPPSSFPRTGVRPPKAGAGTLFGHTVGRPHPGRLRRWASTISASSPISLQEPPWPCCRGIPPGPG